MKAFIEEMSKLGRSLNPHFNIVPQNSLELLTTDDWGEVVDVKFLSHIDGIAREDLHFGYELDDKETPVTTQREWLPYLNLAKANNLTVLVVDHCSTEVKQLRSLKLSNVAGFICFANNRKNFGNVSKISTDNNITKLNMVKSFALQPNLTQALPEVKFNFDLLVISPFVNGAYIKAKDVDKLKLKSNGKKRLLLAMISAVELNSHQPYYQRDWTKEMPEWMEMFNSTTNSEELRAKFWTKELKDLMISGDNSVVRNLVKLNFDGVYLLNADGYLSFEDSQSV